MRFCKGHQNVGQHMKPIRHLEQDRGYETPCWIWQLTKAQGYGKTKIRGKWHLAHRVFYEDHVAPIPEGLVIDHLCCQRDCVNPDHMEPVTIAENVRRGTR